VFVGTVPAKLTLFRGRASGIVYECTAGSSTKVILIDDKIYHNKTSGDDDD